MTSFKLPKPDSFGNYWLDNKDHNRCRAAIFPHKELKSGRKDGEVVATGKFSVLCDVGRFLEYAGGERMFFDSAPEALTEFNTWLSMQP